MQIALYQPDIAQNTGTIIRLCSCLNFTLHIIEPCGFLFNSNKFKRSVLDYIDICNLKRHESWGNFENYINKNKLIPVLATTKSNLNYTDFKFIENNILIMGRESAGVPDNIHNSIKNKITIDMKNNCRSLNVAIACSIITGEFNRQIKIKNNY